MNLFNLKQIVPEATRTTPNSSSLIDVILTNNLTIGAAPDYLCRRLNLIQPGNRPTTRAITHGHFIIPKPKCEMFKNSFSYRVPSFLTWCSFHHSFRLLFFIQAFAEGR